MKARNMTRAGGLSVALLVFLLMLPGEGQAARGQGFDDKEIRIGQTGPQTGPAAAWGVLARGSKLLFDLVNEEGGIHGRKIRYFIRDDQYNPSQTMAAVRDLVGRQDVMAMVGGVGTACGLAVRDYLRHNEIPWVGFGSGAAAFHEPHNPWMWNIWPKYEDDGSILARFTVEELGFRKIAMLYQNDPFGTDGMAGVVRRLQEYDLELVAAVPVEPVDRDLSSQVARLQASGAEAIIGFVAPTQAIIALKTAVGAGFRPQWMHSATLLETEFMNYLSDGLWAREAVMTSTFIEGIYEDTPLMRRYHDAAKRLAPAERWGAGFVMGIAVAEPLVYALEQAGRDLSKEALKNALDSITDFQGIGPRVTWTPDNHLPPRELRIWQCGPDGAAIVVQDWIENELSLE